MKTVKTFTTFNDLKSSEITTTEYTLRLEKHIDFEKVIKEIRSSKAHKGIRINKSNSLWKIISKEVY